MNTNLDKSIKNNSEKNIDVQDIVEKNTYTSLNSNNFSLKNRTEQTTSIIKIKKPYTITILALSKTTINISKSDSSLSQVLVNSTIPEGEKLMFNFESTINFDLLNNAHVRIKLNNLSIDNLLLNNNKSIRGSYEAEKSQLYLGFYSIKN